MGCARAKILLALVLLAFYRVPFCCAGSKRNSAGAGDDWHYADSKTLIDRERGDGGDDDDVGACRDAFQTYDSTVGCCEGLDLENDRCMPPGIGSGSSRRYEDCSSGAECCVGCTCDYGVCVSPDGRPTCALEFAFCISDGDCCGDLVCSDSECRVLEGVRV